MSEKISLDTKRHTGAHVLATAIYDMFPEAQFGVGPTTENGFYYDVLLPRTLIPEDLAILESKMKEIIKANLPVERAEMGIDEAIEHFREAGQMLKLELLQDIKTHGTTNFAEIYGSDEANSSQDKTADIQTVNVYKIGNFVDLCRGPHIESTGQIDSQAFVLDSISASYFRGDQNRESLQRVYGILFNSKKELKEFLHNREEAKKRDHRVLGKSLGLFTFSELVGSGLPLYTPDGTTLKNNIAGLLRQISKKYGSQEVSIPHIAKKELYEISGHAQKFSEELLSVHSHYKQDFVLKPVNCPHHTQLFASEPRSYRDLPIRYIESTMQYRDEKPGQIGGLTRTRGFTVDDGHTFLAVNQIKDEVSLLIKTIADFYTSFGLWENKWVSLSVRDYSDLTKYTGITEDWDKAEQMLEEIAKESGLEAKRCEGEAALYGPKLDFMFYDALGNERQLATIQLDFATPKRFELEYIDEAGDTQTPVMIHRAILGSYERFLAILIEHFAGRFPYWLAPIQVNILSVNDSSEVLEYIDSIKQTLDTVVLSSPLKYNELRYNLDLSSESLGKKIRNSELQKIPVTIIVGPKDVESKRVSIRTHKGESKVAVAELQEFLENFE
jgi:threonyl-tRNA synthetase